MFVLEYFIANCNQICDRQLGGYGIIKQDLVLKTYMWVLGVSQKEPKYTKLVLMENTHWMLEDLQRIHSKYSQERADAVAKLVKDAQIQLKSRFKEALRDYIDEIFDYQFKDKLLTKKENLKSNGEKIALYEKVFPKKEKAHKDIKEMMARVTKHLTKGGTEPSVNKKLEIKCREELILKLEMEVHSGLPDIDLAPWPEMK